jgi:putative flippase GtrA
VNSARTLHERFRHLIHEGARFGVVGGIGFVITDGGTNLLQSPLHGWLKANVIATVAAMIVTYLGSRYWTFRHRERSGMGRETILFLVLNGMGLAIQLACIGITNYAFGRTDKLAANAALLVGICLGTLFRFWSYRRWVWIASEASQALDPVEFAAEQLSHTPSDTATFARGTAVPRQEALDAKSQTTQAARTAAEYSNRHAQRPS